MGIKPRLETGFERLLWGAVIPLTFVSSGVMPA